MQDIGKRSVAWPAFLAIALMLLFFALGVAAIAGLTYAGIGLFQSVPGARGKSIIGAVLLGVACLAAAAAILWSILPRWDRFEPPGPELDREREPELFAEIEALAKATGQAPPAHVYAVLDMNAFVTERGGIMGIGSRRVMGLGIPLMQVLTVAELRAVIAHELGHFHGGDTKAGPWIYKTRAALGRSVSNLGSLAKAASSADMGLLTLMMLGIRKPFVWFFKGFMRVTNAVSRTQEIAADALACRVVGSEPLANGLQKTAGASLGFDLYLREDVGPMIEGGYRPPIVDGFARFVVASNAKDLMAKVSEKRLADDAKADPYDSHPPLRERVAAARVLGVATITPDDRPAITLLRDVPGLEEQALDEKVRELPRIDWEGAAAVYRKGWQATRAKYAKVLATVRAEAMPTEPKALRALMRTTELWEVETELDDDEVRGWARSIFAAGLAELLVGQGFEATTGPGEPITLRRGEVEMNPFAQIGKRFDGELDASDWTTWTDSLGISGKTLA